MKLFCVLLVAMAYYLDSTYACECLPRQPEAHYCQSEFVAVLKIGTRHKESESQFYYDFTVEQVLRATEKGRKSLTSNRITTNGSSLVCGTSLEEGKEYVITGYIDAEGNPHVSLCNYHSLWANVPDDIRTGFLGGYKCSTN